jgi:hypothetical protein
MIWSGVTIDVVPVLLFVMFRSFVGSESIIQNPGVRVPVDRSNKSRSIDCFSFSDFRNRCPETSKNMKKVDFPYS